MQIPRPRGAPAATDGVCDRRRCPAYVAGAEVVEAYDPIGVPSRLPFQAHGEGAVQHGRWLTFIGRVFKDVAQRRERVR